MSVSLPEQSGLASGFYRGRIRQARDSTAAGFYRRPPIRYTAEQRRRNREVPMTRITILKREELNAEQGKVYDDAVASKSPVGGPYYAYIRNPRLFTTSQE